MLRILKKTEIFSNKSDVIELTKRIDLLYNKMQYDENSYTSEFCEIITNGLNIGLNILENQTVVLAECLEVANNMLEKQGNEAFGK